MSFIKSFTTVALYLTNFKTNYAPQKGKYFGTGYI